MKKIITALTMILAMLITASAPSEIPPTAIVQEGDTKTLWGTYNCTAYSSTGNACADGVYPCEGVTVACNDPSLWHKVIEISGTGTEWDGLYYVHDTGSMSVMGTNTIDIFIDDTWECKQFGRRTAEIYVIDVGSSAGR